MHTTRRTGRTASPAYPAPHLAGESAIAEAQTHADRIEQLRAYLVTQPDIRPLQAVLTHSMLFYWGAGLAHTAGSFVSGADNDNVWRRIFAYVATASITAQAVGLPSTHYSTFVDLRDLQAGTLHPADIIQRAHDHVQGSRVRRAFHRVGATSIKWTSLASIPLSGVLVFD